MSCHVVSYHVILRNDYGMICGRSWDDYGLIMGWLWDDYRMFFWMILGGLWDDFRMIMQRFFGWFWHVFGCFFGHDFAMLVASATSSWQDVTSRYDKSSWQVVVTSRYDKSSWQVVVTWQFDVTNWDGLGMACHIISYHSVISQYVMSNHSSMSCHVVSYHVILRNDYGMLFGWLCNVFWMIMACFWNDFLGMTFAMFVASATSSWQVVTSRYDKSSWQVVVTSRYDKSSWQVVVTWQFDVTNWDGLGMACHIISYHSVISQYVILNHSSMSCHVMSYHIMSYCRMIMGWLWDDYRMFLEWIWEDSGMLFGWLCNVFGMIMACFWDDFWGITFAMLVASATSSWQVVMTSRRDKSSWQVVMTSRRDKSSWRDNLTWPIGMVLEWHVISYRITASYHNM